MTAQKLNRQEIMQKLADFSPAERRGIREYLQKKNPLLLHKIDRIKHELLRLESRRIQLEIEKNEVELRQLEEKILLKKELFLKILVDTRKKRG